MFNMFIYIYINSSALSLGLMMRHQHHLDNSSQNKHSSKLLELTSGNLLSFLLPGTLIDCLSWLYLEPLIR